MPDRRKRRMIIKMKRKARAKRKTEAGYKKVIVHVNGRRKVRFVKPVEA